MLSILTLGFLIGMRHALEADHVAAVASLASGSKSIRETIFHGAVWGLGHTLALMAIGSLVIVMNSSVPEGLAHWLEFTVGVMLVVLGADVIRRVVRDRVHFHFHRHSSQGRAHLHAHSHRGEGKHAKSAHEHTHNKSLTARVLAVGLMHGMAGSAALVVLVAGTITTTMTAILYMALFGFGSIVGMAALSAVIAVPLRYSAASMTWAYNGVQAVVGIGTLSLGLYTMYSLGLA
ncbi:high frequency lysogenization protein HflD [Sneathiella sp. CAU 1612]|uniref:High frequency lysogenization protein HflD n=1 Tax=Sneathiella sedimenti TaxID=2816034 RepID=A0ABS3F0T5_9PROT|nr:high frequency lysogenization protein HflD [Sneathiella sedimenti]MBO0332122.1 high frequency lysogenization protein HflD [Sneathiella sedimenti]